VRLAAKRKVNVAITDHNQIQGCIDAAKECRKYDVRVINGIEVSAKQGPHILAYFYSIGDLKSFYEECVKDYKNKNPYMALKTPAEKIIPCIKEHNGIVSIAHPRAITMWDLQRKVDNGAISKDVIKCIDCAEVINGLIVRKMNLRAVKWACENDLGITGGSDCHTLTKLGSVITYSKSHDVHSFLDSIMKNKNSVVGKETRILPRAYSWSKALTKHSRYAGPSMRIQYNLGVKDGLKNMGERISRGSKRITDRFR
jgi:predicted metal-dependent phosphoesterase TrpH